ncbi:LacI family DNA-binding transcriptional regulator [Staphylococcus xylosus]
MVSIRDIAHIAEVSPGTVSRVLNNDPTISVSKNTRERIHQIAKEKQYHKSARKNKSIQIITYASRSKEMSDPYYREIRLAIEAEVKRLNLSLKRTIRIDGNQNDNELNTIEKAGAIIVIGNFSVDALYKLQSYNPNMVVINNPHVPKSIDAVYSDLHYSMTHLLDKIKGLGLTRIAYIGGYHTIRDLDGTPTSNATDVRYKAYQDWCERHQLETIALLNGWKKEHGELAVKTFIESKQELPQVFIAGNDMVAIGVLQQIQENKIAIPENVKLISFNDLEVIQYAVPSISSVHIPVDEFGRTAVRMAEERINQTRNLAIHIVVEAPLKSRNTFKV